MLKPLISERLRTYKAALNFLQTQGKEIHKNYGLSDIDSIILILWACLIEDDYLEMCYKGINYKTHEIIKLFPEFKKHYIFIIEYEKEHNILILQQIIKDIENGHN